MHSSRDNIFDSLVERYRRKLVSAAYHLCNDRDAAYDIVQETLVAAYKGFSSLRDQEKVGGWLFTILRRKAIDHRKNRRCDVELTEDCAVSSLDDAESEVRKIVVEQLSRLSDEDREILAGKYLLGLSYKELAESLGIREGTVRVRALRAKTRLGEILRGVGVGIPKEGDKNGVR